MGALPASSREIRVLVVDDSALMRRAIERLLQQPGIRVVGAACDGIEAVQLAIELRPDVITMDVEMPRMDGVSAVSEIMQAIPTPVVMLSALTRTGAETTIRALEAGAVEAVAKPSGLPRELADIGDRLCEAVVRASVARVRRRVPGALPAAPPARSRQVSGIAAPHLVVIGSSTGGPPALGTVLGHLPPEMNAGVLAVQHMPPGFTAALAARLDSLSPFEVREAAEGDVLAAGCVLVAPGGSHLVVGEGRRVRLEDGPAVHGVRPSIDITLESTVRVYGRDVTAAILTGMGRDGADGCARVEAAGGCVIVQDEATCVVYGMPRVARERTRHAIEAPIERIAALIARHTPVRA